MSTRLEEIYANGLGQGVYATGSPTVEEIHSNVKPDPVNHPAHYTQGRIEVIDFIEDQQLGFHEGNVVKYVARARWKGRELQDLKKAQWYLQRRIEALEGGS